MTALLWAGLIVAAFSVGAWLWRRAKAEQDDYLDDDTHWRGPLE